MAVQGLNGALRPELIARERGMEAGKVSGNFANPLFIMVSQGRFELPTFPLGGGCSIQLSY